jgi:hypothetical protein
MTAVQATRTKASSAAGPSGRSEIPAKVSTHVRQAHSARRHYGYRSYRRKLDRAVVTATDVAQAAATAA